MRYSFGSLALRRTLSSWMVIGALLSACACGDATDMAAASRSLDDAAKQQGTAGRGRAFARPRFELEIAATPKGGSGKTVVPRRLAGRSGGVWSLLRREPGHRAQGALVSPALGYAARELYLNDLEALADDARVLPGSDADTGIRIFARPLARDTVMHLVRLDNRYHEAWLDLFVPTSRTAALRPVALPQAFSHALEHRVPQAVADIAAAYATHAADAHTGLNLAELGDANAVIVMRYLPATFDAETLLLYVDTCYAMLKMAHNAGVFDARYRLSNDGASASIEDFIAAVDALDPELARRLKAWRARTGS